MTDRERDASNGGDGEVRRGVGSIVEEEGWEVDAESVADEVEWRKGFVGGYCSSTNGPHELDDFEEEGVLRCLLGMDGYVCSECGLRLTDEEYERLSSLAEFSRAAVSGGDEPEIRIG
jgi:hypothetical protein